MIPTIPERLLDAASVAAYQLVSVSGWEAMGPDSFARCRSLARVVLRIQRLREAPDTLPGIIEHLDAAALGLHALIQSIPLDARMAPVWQTLERTRELLHRLVAELRAIEVGT